MSIYVEILVRAPMDALWNQTQTPSLHEKWDLRFTRIEYLQKEVDDPRFTFSYWNAQNGRYNPRGVKMTPAERGEFRDLAGKLEPRAFAAAAADHVSPFPVPRWMLG